MLQPLGEQRFNVDVAEVLRLDVQERLDGFMGMFSLDLSGEDRRMREVLEVGDC